MDLQTAMQIAPRHRRSGVSDSDYYPFVGGLNVMATPLQLRSGEMIGGVNYEPRTIGGYRRFDGYERFDGRTPPSQITYYLLNFTGGNPAHYPTAGQTVTGVTSGATAQALAAPVETSPGVGYVPLGALVGAFVNAETIEVGASTFGTTSGTAGAGGASTEALDQTYSLAAQAIQRALIQVVPGSGPVRGVVVYRGVTYAFRDNAGGTAGVMFKSTSSGWSAIPAYQKLKFNTGVVQIVEGSTIVGATSANTAVVRRVVTQSGTYGGSNAAGFLILAAGSPAFVNGELLKVGGVTMCTTVGTATAQAIAPGGQYEFRVKNFYANTATLRIYGCDGVNFAFEYQDSPESFLQIETGTTVDTPTHIAAHRGRLWLAFRGGSAEPSSVNDPCSYSALTGAAELAFGDDITGFLEELKDSLIVYCQNTTHIITGDGPNWVRDLYAAESGALPFTIQRISNGTYLDFRGIATMQQTLAYGNFSFATITAKIQSLIPEIRTKVVCSGISRQLSLYRLFLSDGTIVTTGFNSNKVTGITIVDLQGIIPNCAFSGELPIPQADGHLEQLVIGCQDGFVYELESGINMDGQPINAFFRLAFNFSKTPSRQKRYRRAAFDILTEGRCTLQIAPDYSFSDPTVLPDPPDTISLAGSGGFWDESNWDSFNWDNPQQGFAVMKLENAGTNINFVVSHTSSFEPAHTVQGVQLHKSMRRLERRSMG